LKTKLNEEITLEKLQETVGEISENIFMGEFIDLQGDLQNIISFTHKLIRFFNKKLYYNYKDDTLTTDVSKLNEIQKFENIRDIYETMNFNILSNQDYLNLLPSIILLERIFTFNSMLSNSLNNSISRFISAENFCLMETKNTGDIETEVFNNDIDDRIFYVKKNKMLLLNHIKFTLLNNMNLAIGNYENRNIIFSNLENMLSKFIYLKDILVNNCDLNELLFFSTNIILHYNLSLNEIEKLSNSSKFNKEKVAHLEKLFQEFLISYLNYTIMISQQISNSVKNINLTLLKNFMNSIILLKKSEKENPKFSLLRDNNIIINNFLKDFVEEFFIRMIFSKQSRLLDFLKNHDAYLNLMEISQLFKIENFGDSISYKDLNENLISYVKIKSDENLDLLKYANENYKENNITNL